MSIARGFIFQVSYRLVSAATGSPVPVVQLHGRLQDGRAFLVRDDRRRPHFYVRAADASSAQALGAGAPAGTERRNFAGEPVVRIEVDTPSHVPPLRDRLHANGIDTYEADVRFATRFLIERGIKGGCEIEGEPVAAAAALQRFDNPVLRPADVPIEPRVLSFDIETDAAGAKLLAISLFGPGVDEVLIVDAAERAMPERARRCRDERSALEAFAARVRVIDPDVITGWNVIDFDLAALERIGARIGCPCT